MPDPTPLELETDVLVIGGGPAATWAAITAADEGARVTLVDKGYCGSSGVAATSGVGHWVVPPDPTTRDREIGAREEMGGFLTDRPWTERVLDEAYERVGQVQAWGYSGPPRLPSLPVSFVGQSPGYLRFLRGQVKRRHVRVLDHSPALELLVDDAGAVAGANGFQRQLGRAWTVAAGAVVLATGGTTWKSHSLGGDVDTGDGHLMAAEVGAHLSSMELSSFYGMTPLGTSMDKNGFFVRAAYWREDGTPIDYENLIVSRASLLAASLDGQVYARFDHAPAELWGAMRDAMPNFFMVTDKLGVDPFRDRFPIDWVLEGTVRGTGGVHVLDTDAWTGVDGLYAAGDVAARDRIVGTATGAGGPNLAWALASGTWAGRAAVRHGRGRPRPGRIAGSATVGLAKAGRNRAARSAPDRPELWRDVVGAVQGEMLPIDKNAFRSNASLRSSLTVLDDQWARLVGSAGVGPEAVRLREAAALTLTARWAYESSLRRTETRGMHVRTDHPDTDPNQQHRLLCGGLDEIWVSVDPQRPIVGRAAEQVAS